MPEYINHRFKGPLGAMKSNDLTDQQISALWIPFDQGERENSLSFYDPATPTATLMLGGKGSGKTHLLRFYSFPVQGLRYGNDSRSWEQRIDEDRYIGIYTRAGGLNGNRFSGKGCDSQAWHGLFAYYLELWFGIEFLQVTEALAQRVESLRRDEEALVRSFLECYDRPPRLESPTFDCLTKAMKQLRREVDICVNKLVFDTSLEDIKVCASPGRLVFGLPKMVANLGGIFESVIFSYCVDEYENFLEYQQECVNTLLRERELPVTFRIGVRSYGMKSYSTYSAREDIREGSEYEKVHLDSWLRGDKEKFKVFAQQMVVRRTAEFGGPKSEEELNTCFQAPDLKPIQYRGSHLEKLDKQLSSTSLTPSDVSKILNLFRSLNSEVLQKAAIYSLYQEVANGRTELVALAQRICDQAAGENPPDAKSLQGIVGHFKSDFEAQLRREARSGSGRFDYGSMEDLIVMAEGLPRVFLTLIKSIFGWSNFEIGSEHRNSALPISLDARRRGVEDTSKWFLEDMPQSGDEGEKLVVAINRLATLFRLNRFSDKPTECSLIQFSVQLDRLSCTARNRIQAAADRRLLIRCVSGQKDRNSSEIWAKFHINRVLCPLFQLPTAKRGTARFNPDTAEAIFGDDSDDAKFRSIVSSWEKRLNWPFRLQNSKPSGTLLDGID